MTALLERGVWGILATPFEGPAGPIDHASFTRQIELYARIGARGVVALGVFGESARLSDAERADLVRTAVRAAGVDSTSAAEFGLVLGLSTVGTEATVTQARALLEAASSVAERTMSAIRALMVQVPSAEPAAIVAHLRAVHEATGLGIVVQDYPLISGVHVRAEDLAEAVTACPWVVAVKAEAPPTPPAIATLVARTSVPVFGGLGGVSLLDELAVGAAGAMTGFSQPEGLIETVAAFEREGFAAARAAWSPFLPLAQFEQQAGIALAIRKELLRRRGLIADASVRPPGAPLPESLLGVLDAHLATLPSVVAD
jgi:4-hydroxy-tetrahydrodipicolinate synthase